MFSFIRCAIFKVSWTVLSCGKCSYYGETSYPSNENKDVWLDQVPEDY